MGGRYLGRVSRPPRSVAAALTAWLLVAAAPAALASKRHVRKHGSPPRVTTLQLRRSADLWATVNVCDTIRRPDGVGVRASMPGTRRVGGMTVEFRLQWFRAAARKWSDALSPVRVALGSARAARRETGVTWRLRAPAAGRSMTLRGIVTFEWREGRRTLLRLRRTTTAGRSPSAGSDPKGYSAASCVIRGPAPAP